MEKKPHGEFSSRVSGKQLRDGFTTGTCAAAAAKAAAVILCRGLAAEPVAELTIPAGISVKIPAVLVSEEPGCVCVQVCKDAGDDPDITNGTWIRASVCRIDEQRWQHLHREGCGYWLEDYPECYLTGGYGVGIATKAGLSCPVGSYAINPVPRKMILAAVWEVLCSDRGRGFGAAGISGRDIPYIEIRISVPAGVELAEKTFNPKLGIIGGISIIGTTGVVKPMSEDALRDTIRLELHMKAVQKSPVVFLTPGNYGRSFLKERLDIPLEEAVTCSNYVADAVRMAAAEGITRLLFAGHIGKLIKVSGGVPNTHSQYGDRRMELLGRITEHYDKELALAVREANTTEEAVRILMEKQLAEAVLTDAAGLAGRYLENWGDGKLRAEVVTFSSAYGILGMTREAVPWIMEWKRGRIQGTEAAK